MHGQGVTCIFEIKQCNKWLNIESVGVLDGTVSLALVLVMKAKSLALALDCHY